VVTIHLQPLRRGIDLVEHRRRHERVVDHHVGSPKPLHRPHREQIGRARAGADEGDTARRQ
jgi:hypothetical protein